MARLLEKIMIELDSKLAERRLVLSISPEDFGDWIVNKSKNIRTEFLVFFISICHYLVEIDSRLLKEANDRRQPHANN